MFNLFKSKQTILINQLERRVCVLMETCRTISGERDAMATTISQLSDHIVALRKGIRESQTKPVAKRRAAPKKANK